MKKLFCRRNNKKNRKKHKNKRRGGRPAQVVMPPEQRLLRSPASKQPSPSPLSPPVWLAAKPDEPKVEVSSAFWRPLLSTLGTRPTGLQRIAGASGIDHRAVDVGVDAERKRLIVLNDSPDPMAAAFIQSDLQRAYPDQRIIVARPTLANVGASLREVAASVGFTSMHLQEVMDRLKNMPNKVQANDAFKVLFESFILRLIGDRKIKVHSGGAMALQIINQVTRLNFADLAKEDMSQSVLSIESLLKGFDNDTERQLGICVVPMYLLQADEIENVKASTSLDPARELLQRIGVWEYFFPEGESLALGLVDRGFDDPEKLNQAIELAPKHGHLINERDEVPALETLLAGLQARGLVCEADAKLKVEICGQKVRATVKIKPQEALLVKLGRLAKVLGTAAQLAKVFLTGDMSP